jgi:hypothetical protein
MTPSISFLRTFLQYKEALLRLNDNLPLILGIPFVLFVLFVFFRVFVLSSRKAERILRGLKGKVYQTVCPDDHQLKNVLERLTVTLVKCRHCRLTLIKQNNRANSTVPRMGFSLKMAK